jgi:hypothetical protein
MTSVNFIANILVGSYSQVIVIPRLPKPSGVEEASHLYSESRVALAKGGDPDFLDAEFREFLQHMAPTGITARLAYKGYIPKLDKDKFKSWLRQNYPYLDTDDFRFPRRWIRGDTWSSLFLISMAILIIGCLTRSCGSEK